MTGDLGSGRTVGGEVWWSNGVASHLIDPVKYTRVAVGPGQRAGRRGGDGGMSTLAGADGLQDMSGLVRPGELSRQRRGGNTEDSRSRVGTFLLEKRDHGRRMRPGAQDAGQTT